MNYAAQFVGNPYVYGGSSLTNGADCSGFVMSVYQAFGISLPHSSSALRSVGYGVSLDAIQPGDIVCYSGHVGIYAEIIRCFMQVLQVPASSTRRLSPTAKFWR